MSRVSTDYCYISLNTFYVYLLFSASMKGKSFPINHNFFDILPAAHYHTKRVHLAVRNIQVEDHLVKFHHNVKNGVSVNMHSSH